MSDTPKRARARRPTTADACSRYVELVRGGATEREADALAGVSRHAVRHHPEYGPALERAAAEYLAGHRRTIEAVAGGHIEDAAQARAMLAAASWILGKRDRDNYGEHSRSEVTQTLAVTTRQSPADERAELLAVQAEIAAAIGRLPRALPSGDGGEE